MCEVGRWRLECCGKRSLEESVERGAGLIRSCHSMVLHRTTLASPAPELRVVQCTIVEP